MRLSHFFIDRPIFAAVVSIIFVIVGAVSVGRLPVAQYPEIAPPVVRVSGQYPGASADVVAATVVAPLEQQINGVENMIYMTSSATGDGRFQIDVTLELGTNLDIAQVQVQNRVAIAQPRIPVDVRNIGVTTAKSSPDLMIVVHLYSPDKSRDPLFISNYANVEVLDQLNRIYGVGGITVFGARDYSMRVWLDPDRLYALGLTTGDVVTALQGQNVQVASGVLNQPPVAQPRAFQIAVRTLGRLVDPNEFAEIVVKQSSTAVVRLKDVGRIELAAVDYSTNSYRDLDPAVALAIYQLPGSNALATAAKIKSTMDELSTKFPAGLEYTIIYNPTEFIQQSVDAVVRTLFEAVLLVVIVVILFLQTWRASIIPIVAIPVSLVGTFAVLAAFGFSLNNLSLFGLVLAIGIVVDDAIVVVENVERNLRLGMSPKEAAHRTMDEVGGALIAIALVLSAVFIPAAFIPGISGQFFRQFAITIASATIISCLCSLTLSPALCALLFKPHQEHAGHGSVLTRPITAFFRGFNYAFDKVSAGYGALTRRLLRVAVLALVVYAGLIGLTGWQFVRAPTGFIPNQDQGYLITVLQLPPGASLARTDAVVRRTAQILRNTPGVAHAVQFAGFDGATFTNAPNAGAIFSPLQPFQERAARGLSADVILADMRKRLAEIQDAFIITISPPTVRGIGTAGGFKMMLQDKRGRGLPALETATQEIVTAANQLPGLVGVFSLFNTRTPKVYADIDRVRAEMLDVPASRVFETLQVYLGSAYVNDFNYLGRTYRVTAQADAASRDEIRDIVNLKTRNDKGQMVPIGSVTQFRDITGPYRVPRYNLYPAAEVQGSTLPGYSTGYALAAMQQLAADRLPDGFGFDWTDLAYQQKLAGNSGFLVFGASIVFVFLVLAAQYESWTLPLAVILIVPMCLLAAVSGLLLRGMDVNILAQVGFVVLVGLAAKNAILIVEFARQAEEEGKDRFDAAVQAARTRLRPILMTSFAFIFGVVPLAIATGAGAEMRQSLGTAVFFGMLGVTGFGLIFTPVFYVVVRGLFGKRRTASTVSAELAAKAAE